MESAEMRTKRTTARCHKWLVNMDIFATRQQVQIVGKPQHRRESGGEKDSDKSDGKVKERMKFWPRESEND